LRAVVPTKLSDETLLISPFRAVHDLCYDLTKTSHGAKVDLIEPQPMALENLSLNGKHPKILG
jgi:hypothetical protein